MSPLSREPASPGFDLGSAGSENSRGKNKYKQNTFKSLIVSVVKWIERAPVGRTVQDRAPRVMSLFSARGLSIFNFFFVKS